MLYFDFDQEGYSEQVRSIIFEQERVAVMGRKGLLHSSLPVALLNGMS